MSSFLESIINLLILSVFENNTELSFQNIDKPESDIYFHIIIPILI